MTCYDNYLDVLPTELGSLLMKKRAEQEWRLINLNHPNISQIIEIGPGFGGLGSLIDLGSCHYFILETHPQIAEFNKKIGFEVCRTFIPPLPIKSNSIELVYASHVIEHMIDPSAALFFVNEIFRVLKPDGLLYLSAPDIQAFGQMFWDVDYTHTFPVTKRRLQQLLRDAGFYSLEFRYFYGPYTGCLSFFLGFISRIFIPDLLPIPDVLKLRLVRLRYTFLRNISVIAKKV
jgi:SAM-dependent methyltransferase